MNGTTACSPRCWIIFPDGMYHPPTPCDRLANQSCSRCSRGVDGYVVPGAISATPPAAFRSTGPDTASATGLFALWPGRHRMTIWLSPAGRTPKITATKLFPGRRRSGKSVAFRRRRSGVTSLLRHHDSLCQPPRSAWRRPFTTLSTVAEAALPGGCDNPTGLTVSRCFLDGTARPTDIADLCRARSRRQHAVGDRIAGRIVRDRVAGGRQYIVCRTAACVA